MRGFSFILVFLLGLSQANAKTLLISDIDDTIKNSHVLSWSDALLNANKIENNVLGMSVLYSAMKRSDSSLKFFYVTNAPGSLMETNHRKFLSYNQFPQGTLHLRQSVFQNDFKVTEIRKIIKSEKPNIVILIGDNGEKDITIYNQITQEFPGILFLTYIRQAYSTLNNSYTGSPLMKGQTGFVTSMDLLAQLRKTGHMTSQEALGVLQYFIIAYDQEVDTNKNGNQAIPAWLDCRDFKWTAKDADLDNIPDYQKTKARLLERCSIRALAED